MTTARARSPWVAVVVLSVGLFMTLLDLTIVNIAIPDLIDELGASLDEVLWIVNSYILVLAVLLILAGRLGDIVGPRKVFVVGTALFTASSALCGLSGSAGLLIAARAVQGLGAALMTPQPLTVIVSLFPPEKRGAAFGVNGITAGVATAAGPVLGGVLVDAFDWRAIFYVNVPIGIAAIAATLWLVPDVRPGVRHRFDMLGVALLSAGLVACVFGLIEGQRYDWGTVWSFVSIPLLLAVGVALIAAFILTQRARQRGGHEPLVPFALFHSRNYSLMNVAGAGIQLALVGVFFSFTIYLQSVLGLSPLKAGLVLVPASLVSMVVAPIVGRLADRYGGKYLLMFGLSLYGATTAVLLAISGAASDPWIFVPVLAVSGAGMGCVFVPMIHVAMVGVRPQLAGAASGVLNTTRQLGSVIGAAAVGAILQNRLAAALGEQAASRAHELPAAARAPFVAAFRSAAEHGLNVGAAQATHAFKPPPGTPDVVAERLAAVGADVFGAAFTTAMHWTLALPIVVLGATALLCLAIRNARGDGAAAPAAEGVTRPQE